MSWGLWVHAGGVAKDARACLRFWNLDEVAMLGRPVLQGRHFNFFQGGAMHFSKQSEVLVRGCDCAYMRTREHEERFTHALLLYAHIIVVRVHYCCTHT